MGRPTTDLFYGFHLGSEGSWYEDPDDACLPEWVDGFDLEEPLGADHKQCPVALVSSGYEESEKAIAITASWIHSDWDSNPKDLTNSVILNHTPAIREQWDLILREYAKRLGLSWDKILVANKSVGPRWLLVTSGPDG